MIWIFCLMMNPTSLPGNDRFYSSNVSKTPESVKNNYKAKFEPKLLVWICISPKGLSEPVVLPSGSAVDQDVYLEQMIKQRLVPFINRHYKSGRYVIWPDLAPAHYARKVTSYLTEKKINFVPRVMNPANLPKARPIEDFLGSLKLEVHENDWVAKDLDELKA
jgi:hypothetical protein